ncbi:MAG: DNA polymerase III subunit gamma/tau, partial [Candidatus Igneacidithiobacillus chanchocoensis]
SACRGIAQGSFVDLLEVDAASRTRVDETRDLLDNVQYAPSVGRYKVYLIDEVHMLSTHSFNALLKTLEEPPAHVKFLLATTDPQKIPATILSRCLQFHLRRLEPDQIVARLQQILAAEGIAASTEALAALAQAADGSLRDALSLTDQAIAQGAGQVDLDTVVAMLGLCPRDVAANFLLALLDRDAQRVFALLQEQLALGQDAAALLDALIEELHRMGLAQWLDEARRQLFPALQERVTVQSPLLLQSWYHILLSARRDFALYPNTRMAIEMALLRLLAFLLPEGPRPALSVPTPVPAAPASTETNTAMPAPKAERHMAAPSAAAALSPQAAWEALLPQLSVSDAQREFLRHSRARHCDASRLELALDPAYESLLRREEDALRAALRAHWQADTVLEISTLEPGAEVTLAQEGAARSQAEREAIAAAALADPRLQEFQQELPARLLRLEIDGRIHPL